MQYSFTKMHGLGNDFVVFDAVSRPIHLSAEQIRFIADRHQGIGCDQVLLVEPSVHPEAQFRYRIFNADGGEVEQCGNGARCFARFVVEQGLTDLNLIPVETAAGLIQLVVNPGGDVTVDMGMPEFTPARIPFVAEAEAEAYAVQVEGETVTLAAVSMGNPHAVVRVEDVYQAPVQTLGAALESHPRFPRRVNVGFMQVLDPGRIRLRVFERGVGETQACGTGACAAMVAGRRQGWLDATVQVELPGGQLVIKWQGPGHPVLMTGPATRVFEGRIEL